jgi:segregation and condensation protein B
MTEVNPELKNIVEAALLVSGQPVTIDKLLTLFPDGDSKPARDDIRAAIDALAAEYESRGMELRQIDKGWRVQTRAKYGTWIQRLTEERPPRYSRALLETLAIIAYRQPVSRADIEEIRGVGVSSEIIKTLLGREWIREVGRREVPGRPSLYGTTREFLEHFSLKSLEELPPLAALRDIEQIGAELDQRLAHENGIAVEIAAANDASVGDGGGEPGDEPAPREAAAETAESEPVAMEARPAASE